MKLYDLAIVGAGGLVGRKMLEVLEQRNFPVGELKLFASARSAGSKVVFRDKEYTINELQEDSFEGLDIALFSAGSSPSLTYAPIAAKSGCVVIDNSSAWRRDDNIPLVVPEVNPHDIRNHKGIIANPNCNVIPLAVAFKPIADKYGISRAVVSTYQSISGAGAKGLDKLNKEIDGQNSDGKHPIFGNTVFHPIEKDSDFTNEEVKLQFETRKILGDSSLKVAATCVRLPFFACHAESVNLELKSNFDIDDIKSLLAESDGIVLMDDLENEIYPTPVNVAGRDEVFVGRIRRDDTIDNGLYLWVVSDNIRKGAATNAVQIAEKLVELL